MSDWLIILLVLAIVAIVLDGFRRARIARRNEVKLSRNARRADQLLDEESGAESEPTVGHPRRTHAGVESVDSAKPGARARALRGDADPRQASLDLDEPVPMLMESVLESEGLADEDCDEDNGGERRSAWSPQEAVPPQHFEPALGDLDDLDSPAPPAAPHQTEPREAAPVEAPLAGLKTASHKLFARGHTESKPAEAQKADNAREPSEILIINLMAPRGELFSGAALLDAFTDSGLRFGQRGIFHRHVDDDGDAPIVFSLANIVEPGTFDFATMPESTTPGLCLFLRLPTSCEPLIAYEDFVATAKNLATAVGGELKDENRSVLTKQTVEHGRQRVTEFQRKLNLSKH